MKLSIIVPVYNAGPYIKVCLESILNQDLEPNEFELIIVDDSSTDNTVAIISSICESFTNFIIIQNENNLGNGAARNQGLEIAKGDYIYFIDADDYLAKGTLSTVVDTAHQFKLQMTFFKSLNVTNSSHSTSSDALIINTEAINIIDGIKFIGQNSYRDEIWGYLIERKFLSDSLVNYYHEKMFAQDLFITTKLLTLAKRVCLLDFDVYRYRLTANSIVRKKNIDHLIFHIDSVETALYKCHNLRTELMNSGVQNTNALLRLKAKQERFVTIIIMRFVQTDLPFKYMKEKLKNYKKIGLYPMDAILKLPDFNFRAQRQMNIVFNRPYLLQSFTWIYRLYQKIKS